MLKKYTEILNINATIAAPLFAETTYPWEVLPKIKDYILTIGPNLSKEEYLKVADDIWVHKTAIIATTATINSPCIIGTNTEIRHCAFIRGSAIIGDNCVIGNSTEVKNSIIFNNCECPHFNYIGDAILGEHAHTGAGVILSNVKSDRTNIIIKDNNDKIPTNLRKMSAILGDNTEIGCNSVICPGSIIGKNTTIYPLTMVRGTIPSNKIVKSLNNIISKK